MVDQYSQNIDMQDISLFWQLTIKTIDDLRIVGSEEFDLRNVYYAISSFKKY